MAKNKGNQPPNIPQNNHTPALSADLVKQFLDLQKQELQVRTEELTIHAQQEENQKCIAEASIAANLEDRENERAHKERRTKILFFGAIVIIFLILMFAGFSIFAGQSEIVMKLVEIVAIFVAGFFGGYGYKSSKSQPDQNIKD